MNDPYPKRIPSALPVWQQREGPVHLGAVTLGVKTASPNALLLILYLRGISAGDFQRALADPSGEVTLPLCRASHSA